MILSSSYKGMHLCTIVDDYAALTVAEMGSQILHTLSYVPFKLSYFAKYRCKFVEKHNADLLQVGQNALVRMGHRMKQNWKGKNRKARSDKAKAAGNHGKGNTAIQGTGCQDNATGPHPSGNVNIHYHKVMQQEWKADRQSKSRDRMQAVEVGQTLSVLSCRHYQPLKPDRAM